MREAVTQTAARRGGLRKMEADRGGLWIDGCSSGLLKRGTQASASEENQSMARPFSSALPPALKEKASSQGCGASGQRIWATAG